jgi:hypothetical protein
MLMNTLSKSTRRRFLLNTGMLAAGWELACADAALTQELAPTPSCRDGDEPAALSLRAVVVAIITYASMLF